MLQTTFETTEDAAEAVVQYSRDEGKDFLRPVLPEHFNTSDSTWWLVPQRKSPLSRYGRIALAADCDGFPAAMFVGLVIEKGLGESAAPSLIKTHSARCLMQADWTWHPFLRSLRSGAFRADLDRLGSLTGAIPYLQVRADRMNKSCQTELTERVGFFVEEKRARIESRPDETTVLLGIGEGDDLRAVGEKLANITDSDWIWITFFAGLLFDVAPPRTAGAFDEEALWEKAVMPWSAWLR